MAIRLRLCTTKNNYKKHSYYKFNTTNFSVRASHVQSDFQAKIKGNIDDAKYKTISVSYVLINKIACNLKA